MQLGGLWQLKSEERGRGVRPEQQVQERNESTAQQVQTRLLRSLLARVEDEVVALLCAFKAFTQTYTPRGY